MITRDAILGSFEKVTDTAPNTVLGHHPKGAAAACHAGGRKSLSPCTGGRRGDAATSAQIPAEKAEEFKKGSAVPRPEARRGGWIWTGDGCG